MRTNLSIALACTLAAVVSTPAAAQSFTNGTFNSSLTGWTVLNTTNGVGAPGTVASVDIDGPGSLGSSNAASFQAGQATFQTGVQRGVEMTQVVPLVAGTTYRVQFDWSAQKFSGANASDGGVFSVIVNGAIVAQGSAGVTGVTLPRYGRVTANDFQCFLNAFAAGCP